jgi:hypothetical protein
MECPSSSVPFALPLVISWEVSHPSLCPNSPQKPAPRTSATPVATPHTSRPTGPARFFLSLSQLLSDFRLIYSYYCDMLVSR